MTTLRKSRVHNISVLAVMTFGLLLLAASTGIAIGLGSYILVAPLALALPGLFLLMRPDICLVFYAGLTLIVAGTLKYFFELAQFQWALSALGIALLCYAIAQLAFSKTIQRTPSNGFSQAIILWWVGLIFTSIANALPLLDWLVGIRIYLPVFGVFAYVAYCRPPEKLLKGIFIFMLTISSIQWMFALYQKLVVVPSRISAHYIGSSFDSIVGTFGGDKFGGGESGSLGVYLSIMVIVAIALNKHNQIRTMPLITILLTSLAGMAIVESKVIAVMIPLGCLLVYRDYILKKTGKFILGGIVIGALMIGLLVTYYYLYWQTDSRQDLVEAFRARLAYSFDPNFQASATHLGRVKALVFWWENNSLFSNPLSFLIGHGLASAVSSSSLIGVGSAVREYHYVLDVTGASKLLWETGILGLIVYLAIYLFGFRRAQKLSHQLLIPPWHRAAMRGVDAAMVLMPLSIFYEVTVLSSPPLQFVAMFFLGYVAYWWRETQGQGANRV